MNPVNEQLDEQVFTYISIVSDELAVYKLGKRLHFQRFPVINITRGDHEVEYLPFVVAYQMELEPLEPVQGAFVALSYASEYLVHVYTLVAASRSRVPSTKLMPVTDGSPCDTPVCLSSL